MRTHSGPFGAGEYARDTPVVGGMGPVMLPGPFGAGEYAPETPPVVGGMGPVMLPGPLGAGGSLPAHSRRVEIPVVGEENRTDP